MSKASSRLISLDQFRGYTVAGMFFVNFCGYEAVAPLWRHHNNYCSYADTIMPQFLFAVGFAFRLTFGRRIEREGRAAAYARVARRLAGLMLLAVVIYEAGDNFPTWKALSEASWGTIFETPLKRSWFQTLMHIAVTSLWVLPVISEGPLVRVAYMVGSSLLHVYLSWLFYFRWVNTGPVGIDGGPLGFLTWSIPLLVGSLACDAMTGRERAPVERLLGWSVALMALGYLFSCPTVLYDLPGARVPAGYDKIAASPVWPDWNKVSGRPWRDLLAEPPFVMPPPGDPPEQGPSPPVLRQWNYWMMSQRGGTLSYLIFSAGFSLAVYAAFVVLCDWLPLRVGVFRTLGTNALAGYIAHPLVGAAVKAFVPGDSPVEYVLAAFLVYFVITYLLIRHLERNDIYLRM